MFSLQLLKMHKILQSCEYTSEGEKISEKEVLQKTYKILSEVKEYQGKAYLIGNGGSAGIASHFSIDLLNIVKISSFTFFDSNQMTCIANDYGYEKVFSLPLANAIGEKDLLIAISSSGASRNILEGVVTAKKKGAKVITYSGFFSNNPLRELGDINYWVDSSEYGVVETLHFFLLHTLIDFWHLYGDNDRKLAYARENQELSADSK